MCQLPNFHGHAKSVAGRSVSIGSPGGSRHQGFFTPREMVGTADPSGWPLVTSGLSVTVGFLLEYSNCNCAVVVDRALCCDPRDICHPCGDLSNNLVGNFCRTCGAVKP